MFPFSDYNILVRWQRRKGNGGLARWSFLTRNSFQRIHSRFSGVLLGPDAREEDHGRPDSVHVPRIYSREVRSRMQRSVFISVRVSGTVLPLPDNDTLPTMFSISALPSTFLEHSRSLNTVFVWTLMKLQLEYWLLFGILECTYHLSISHGTESNFTVIVRIEFQSPPKNASTILLTIRFGRSNIFFFLMILFLFYHHRNALLQTYSIFTRSIATVTLTPAAFVTSHPCFSTLSFRDLVRFPAVSPLVAKIIEFPVISRRNTLYLPCRGMSTVSTGLGAEEKYEIHEGAATNRGPSPVCFLSESTTRYL